MLLFFFQAEDGIRDADVTGVQTCALPIFTACGKVAVDIDEAFIAFEGTVRPTAHIDLAARAHIRAGCDAGSIARPAVRLVHIAAEFIAKAFVDLAVAVIVEAVADLFGDDRAFAQASRSAVAERFTATVRPVDKASDLELTDRIGAKAGIDMRVCKNTLVALHIAGKAGGA